MIYFGDLGARKGNWSVALDTIYMNLGATETTTFNIIGRPEEREVDVDMRAFISTLNAGYMVAESQNNRLDIIGGVRYL